MKKSFCTDGLTIVEIIMTLAILGIVICPLMSLFVFSQKINNESEMEYKSILQAQKYMEEIQVMDKLDTLEYPYNSESADYERIIPESSNNFSTKIKIHPDGGNMLYSIKIVLTKDEKVINILEGTKIFN